MLRRVSVVRGALGAVVVVVGAAGPSAAWAQCTDTTPFGAIIPGLGAEFFPLGKGAAVSSVVSAVNSANTAFLTGTTAFVSAPGGPRPDQQGGGVWGRAIGGSSDTDANSVLTPTSPLIGVAPSGNVSCQTRTRSDYYGFQVGHDISILNGGGTGANWHWGVTAGYFEADSSERNFGAFSSNFQAPFAGVYTAFTKGNFALDAQARWDFYSVSLNDATNGIFNQTMNGNGFSLTGNASYNIPLQRNWFIEPSVGAVWSKSQFDPLNVSGTIILSNSPFLGAPGTVQIHDIESFLGRVSLSAGTTFATGGVTWQPFVTASLFHEFMGDAKATVSTRFEEIPPPANIFNLTGADNGTATITTSRVGTYGQFTLGTAAVLGNTGWLGYSRVDYKIGDNIEGWSVNAGLRYQFSPGPGRRSVKDDYVVASHTYNWTGLYLGAFAGRMIGDEHGNFVDLTTGKVDNEYGGYLLGGQAGYNLQLGRVVLGVEGDIGGTNSRGAVSCPNAFLFSCETEAERLASVTGRVGVTWGRALFYAKGGWTGGEVALTLHQNTGGNPILGGVQLVNPVSTSQWMNGWTAGGGMEFALTDRWSAKAEYMHYDLGSERFTVSDLPETIATSVRGDAVKIGVNYHFHSVRNERPLK